MATATLTVNLTAEEIEFLQKYALRHHLSTAEVVGRCLKKLKSEAREPIHPEVAALSGLAPVDVDAVAEHRQLLLDKHG